MSKNTIWLTQIFSTTLALIILYRRKYQHVICVFMSDKLLTGGSGLSNIGKSWVVILQRSCGFNNSARHAQLMVNCVMLCALLWRPLCNAQGSQFLLRSALPSAWWPTDLFNDSFNSEKVFSLQFCKLCEFQYTSKTTSFKHKNFISINAIFFKIVVFPLGKL